MSWGVLAVGSGVFHQGRGVSLFWGVRLSGLKGAGLELPIPPRIISTCLFLQALATPAVPGVRTRRRSCHPCIHPCIHLWCLLPITNCLKAKKTLLGLPLCLNQLNLHFQKWCVAGGIGCSRNLENRSLAITRGCLTGPLAHKGAGTTSACTSGQRLGPVGTGRGR